jgi:hypothetical protein
VHEASVRLTATARVQDVKRLPSRFKVKNGFLI